MTDNPDTLDPAGLKASLPLPADHPTNHQSDPEDIVLQASQDGTQTANLDHGVHALRKTIYKRIVLTIIPPIASTMLQYVPLSPGEHFDAPILESGKASTTTTTENVRSPTLTTPTAELEVDTALPAVQKPLGYFVNLLTTALIYAGIGDLDAIKAKLEHLLGHENMEIDVLGASEDHGYDSDLDEDLENGSIHANSEAILMQQRFKQAQKLHDQGDENEVAKLLESLAFDENENNIDQLYQTELEKDNYEASLIGSSSRRSLNSTDFAELDKKRKRAGFAPLSIFQKSILQNLNPHRKQSFFSKFKAEDSMFDYEESNIDRNKRENLYLHIADKLQRVFELDENDRFYGNYNVWLVNDVLLQGHLYLTRENILFFAFLPKKEDKPENLVIQSGSLGMRSSMYGETVFTNVLTHRFWAVLKTDTLALYGSTTDFYFPKLLIDLKSCLRAEIIPDKGILCNTLMSTANIQKSQIFQNSGLQSSASSINSLPSGVSSTTSPNGSGSRRGSNEDADLTSHIDFLNEVESIVDETEKKSGGAWFKLVTKKKTYKFYTDNLYIAREWVINLTKLIFQLRNTNSKDEVLFKIPIEYVIDFERNSLFGSSSEVKAAAKAAAKATTAATASPTTPTSSKPVDKNDTASNEQSEQNDGLIHPTTFSITYTSVENTDDLSDLMKKKWMRSTNKKKKVEIIGPDGMMSKKEASTKYGIDEIFFLFFMDGDDFFIRFKELMLNHTKTSKHESMSERILGRSIKIGKPDTKKTKRLISTLQPTDNKLISTLIYKARLQEEQLKNMVKNRQQEQTSPISLSPKILNYDKPHIVLHHQDTYSHIDDAFAKSQLQRSSLKGSDSDGSKMKKIGKTLSLPTKMFTKKRTSSNTDVDLRLNKEDSAPVALERSHSEAHLNSIISTPKNHINLPRQLSFTGLRNLNMAIETFQRDMDVAEMRYGDEFDAINTGNLDDEFEENESTLDGITIGNGQHSRTGKTTTIGSSKKDYEFLVATPLNISDPTEIVKESKKSSKIKTIGKAIGNVSTLWSSNPSHYIKMMVNDPYFETDRLQRSILQMNFQNHFTLRPKKQLVASYLCHLSRTIPVYGKLYIGNSEICFRSLLPGVATKMIVPLADIESCYREKGIKLTYSGLVVQIKNYEELFFEFSSQKSRDDCELVLIDRLESFTNELEEGADIAKVKETSSRIELARIKLFEDKLNAAAGLDIPIILEDSPFFKTEIRPTSSYNFTLLTIGSRGDVQPYVALAKGLMAEGHNVTIATHVEFKDWILKHEINFKEIAGNPTELMALMVAHGSMSVAFIKEASSKFRGWINELLYSSWEACQGTDILIESPSAMCGIHIAEALGIPYFRAFTMPWTRTRAYPHAFIVPDQRKGGSYNYLTHVMFETVFWKGISTQVNRWRVEELGISRTNLFKMQQTKIPFLYNISPSVFPPSVDFPDWVKVTGYWFLDEGTGNFKPDDELQQFIDSARKEEKKLIYIGFGSIVVKNARTLTKAIIEAVLDSDVRCILNKGWSDRLSKKDDLEEIEDNEAEVEIPPEIFNSGNVPHDWLFPKVDAVVHHGGSGTTGASLRAGVPTIIKPFFGDQFFYASRVEEIGAGLALRKLNSKTLSKSIRVATSDSRISEKAKSIQQKIKKENGVLNAVECIYSELEYARDLMVSKQLENLRNLKSGTQTPIVYEDDILEGNEELKNSSEEEDEVGDETDILKENNTKINEKLVFDNVKTQVSYEDDEDEKDFAAN